MLKDVSLSNIGDGLAGELFDRELQKVLANIADDETSAEAKREIVMKFSIKPNKSRSTAVINVDADSKLAKASGEAAALFLSRGDNGRIRATTTNPKQADFLDQLEAKIQ